MQVAIIGIDGLDPKHVHRWQDSLPNIRELLREGAFGKLRSSHPPLTSPAWPTMYTGKQGGKHGVFSFTREEAGSYEQRPVNFTDVRAESLWEALDGEGLTCGVINVPLTYPPSDLERGFVISGWPVPRTADEIASDPAVVDRLETALGEPYRVNPFPLTAEFDQFGPERLAGEISDGLDHHRRAFRHLLLEHGKELDAFFGVFMALDVASHNFAWHKEFLKELYVEQDRALGDLLDALPEGADVIVMSDHGHVVRGEWSFHVNEWLRERGYLSTADDGMPDAKGFLRRAGITQHNLVRLANVLGLRSLKDRLPGRVVELLRRTVPTGDAKRRDFDPSAIDWTETTVYSAQQNLLTVNTADKPCGQVTEAEYDSLLADIVSDLQSVDHPDPTADRSLLSELHTKDDIFDGPYVDRAPDLVFVADEMRCNAPRGFGGQIFSEEQWGEHRKYGCLITSGPDFDRLETDAETANIVDLFPLVLALCGTPIPENVDGTIPRDRLCGEPEPTFREDRDDVRRVQDYSDSESDSVEDQLRGLGYLE